ncbi:MAG: gliding motility-associated protein GldE [Flavobacteriales bacterium]|nr:gliding motility-associated protein GldE [Flavobacteriales bacterium]
MLVLLLASAAMSASELALFSLSPTQLRDLKEQGGTRGQQVLELLAKPRRLLATILIASTFVNMGIIVLSTFAVTELLDTAPLPGYMVVSLHVLVVAFMIVLIGEVIPKVYSATEPMRTAKRMAPALQALRSSLWPLSEALVRSTGFIEKRYRKKTQQPLSVDALGQALELTRDGDTSDEEQRILRGIVKFGNIEVRQVMRPRTEVVGFPQELTFKELLAAIVDSGFSRVPVYAETLDKVVGVLYIKDILPHIDRTEFDWLPLLRDPYFVPESKKLDDLLKEFQQEKVHLAIVVDEYGGTSGIITLEDVIEEIVGDITDEYDDEDVLFHRVDERTWIIEGKASLNDMYRVLGTDGDLFEEHKGDSGTLGGFILELMGRIPRKGERTDFGDYTLVVEASDNKRVRRVKVIHRDAQED